MGACHSDNSVVEKEEFEQSDTLKDASSPPPPQQQSYSTTNSVLAAWENEKMELDLHRFDYVLWDGASFSAPVSKLDVGGARVLDIGCGRGGWILHVASRFEDSSFVGIDINPIFPSESPPNVEFRIHDVLDGLPFEDETFDFVMVQNLGYTFTSRQWQDIILKEVLRVLRPSGWFEWMQIDLEMRNQGPGSRRLLNAFKSVMYAKGINPELQSEIPRLIKGTRKLKNIQRLSRKLPIGNWSRSDIGKAAIRDGVVLFRSVKKASIEFMSGTSEDYDKLLEMYQQEVEEYKSFTLSERFLAQKIEI